MTDCKASAYLARTVKDNHREADALQSVINALYFQGFVVPKDNQEGLVVPKNHQKGSVNIEKEENAISFLLNFGEYIREKLIGKGEDQKFHFPIVASKSMLVEGDLYFSWLFFLGQKIKLNRISCNKLQEFCHLLHPGVKIK